MKGIRYVLCLRDKVTSITNYGISTTWDGSMMQARCHKARWKPDHKEVPHTGCSCGFYAFDKTESMDGLVDWIAHTAMTILVEGYGKVVICKRGFRAKYMQPSYVVWPLEIDEKKSVMIANGDSLFTHWQHFQYFIPEFDLAIKTSKLLGVPLISPADAQKLL